MQSVRQDVDAMIACPRSESGVRARDFDQGRVHCEKIVSSGVVPMDVDEGYSYDVGQMSWLWRKSVKNSRQSVAKTTSCLATDFTCHPPHPHIVRCGRKPTKEMFDFGFNTALA